MKKTAMSLLLALVLFVSLCMAVSAEAPPDLIDATNIVQLDDLTAPEVPQDDIVAPAESLAQPEEAVPTEAEAPEPDSGNTPYMVGAAIAVLVFIGVAFYCKHHGDKTL